MRLADHGKFCAILEILMQNKTAKENFLLWGKKNFVVGLYPTFKAHPH